MENQIICFDEIPLPIKLHNLTMCHGGVYRGIHAHAAVEIVKVKSGQLECYINYDRMQLHAGEIILINSNVGHRLCSQNADISYMHIDIHFFTESTNDNAFSKLYEFISRTKAKPYLLFPDNKEMQEIFHKISLRYFENNMSSRWYMKACIYELIGFMYAQSFITIPIISGKQIEKIKSVVRYIDDNFRYPIMLDEICAAVGYNKYAVCHNFKSVTGAAVFDYIKRRLTGLLS